MLNRLLGGIPKERDYKLLIESNEFKELERFSNNFLNVNKNALENYSKKWVKDPLHQWSRQWEYPYVFSRVQSIAKDKETIRILDAGSGVTFFPRYIKAQYGSSDIYCVDYDENLADIYQQINAYDDNKVNFSCADLKKLPYEDNWFDMIYCISVLEHTEDYDEIIEEFHRVLRPGGRLIITFDISLDGTRDISVEKGAILLMSLEERYEIAEEILLDLKFQVSMPGIFTTVTAKDIDMSLLPWKFPPFVYQVKSFIMGKRPSSWPPPLTVFCLSLKKRFV